MYRVPQKTKGTSAIGGGGEGYEVTNFEEHSAGTKTQRWIESNRKIRHSPTYLQATDSQQGH